MIMKLLGRKIKIKIYAQNTTAIYIHHKIFHREKYLKRNYTKYLKIDL